MRKKGLASCLSPHSMGGGVCQHRHPFDFPGSPALRFVNFLGEVKNCGCLSFWTPEETVDTLIDGLSVGGLSFPDSSHCYKKKFLSVATVGRAVWPVLTQR